MLTDVQVLYVNGEMFPTNESGPVQRGKVCVSSLPGALISCLIDNPYVIHMMDISAGISLSLSVTHLPAWRMFHGWECHFWAWYRLGSQWSPLEVNIVICKQCGKVPAITHMVPSLVVSYWNRPLHLPCEININLFGHSNHHTHVKT